MGRFLALTDPLVYISRCLIPHSIALIKLLMHFMRSCSLLTLSPLKLDRGIWLSERQDPRSLTLLSGLG